MNDHPEIPADSLQLKSPPVVEIEDPKSLLKVACRYELRIGWYTITGIVSAARDGLATLHVDSSSEEDDASVSRPSQYCKLLHDYNTASAREE